MIPDHTHEWDGDETRWACTQCEATTATCLTCWGPVTAPSGGPSHLQLCDRCHYRERGTIGAIRNLAADMAPEPRSAVPAYAMDLATARSTDADRLPFGLDRVTDDLEAGITGIRTREGVEDELLGWVALWSEASGAYRNFDCYKSLMDLLLWAAHNQQASHWDTYRKRMRNLLGHLRSLAPPEFERAGPPCLDCGGPLVREWRADGLGENVFCRNCLRQYTEPAYRLALRAKIEREREQADDTWHTEAELTIIYPSLTSGALRKWAERGVIQRNRNRANFWIYRLGDVRERLGDATDAA